MKSQSLHRSGSALEKSDSEATYDYLKEMIKLAQKNGWDLKGLGLVQKDMPPNPSLPLTRKEFQERNRHVTALLKRFSKALTPPVPLDLEKSIRRRKKENWLPWEAEAVEKAETWRRAIKAIKPEILQELTQIHLRISKTSPSRK